MFFSFILSKENRKNHWDVKLRASDLKRQMSEHGKYDVRENRITVFQSHLDKWFIEDYVASILCPGVYDRRAA